MKIFFLENSEINYDGNDKHNSKIRGAESVLINLSENLAILGHDVTVFNNCKDSKKINQVKWTNINFLYEKKINNSCDIAIVQSDSNLLDLIMSKKNFLLSHSIQSIEKFLRKKQFLSFIKNKPIVIVASRYQKKHRSFFTSMFGKFLIPWAVDDLFINCNLKKNTISKKAIFTTSSYRNRDILIEIWNNMIFPQSRDSILYINPPFLKTKENNIKVREMTSTHDLIDELKDIRVMLVPGHKGEVFCLAAQEALEMCIPIVTFGIGALNERVEHGVTGYIAKSKKEFADFSSKILNDQNVWQKFRNNLLKKRGLRTWKMATLEFENILKNSF